MIEIKIRLAVMENIIKSSIMSWELNINCIETSLSEKQTELTMIKSAFLPIMKCKPIIVLNTSLEQSVTAVTAERLRGDSDSVGHRRRVTVPTIKQSELWECSSVSDKNKHCRMAISTVYSQPLQKYLLNFSLFL